MASAKKKQDEKNLKMLRELVSQHGNKECFDCQQRGPTYVNMTIGSFVCTTCSGMLRGLTPPHRVKSISMATFTQEEIDFLAERGNERCRAIWLGLMQPRSLEVHCNKDEQKIRDFMSAKYELKRYYLDPAMAAQLPNKNSKTTELKITSTTLPPSTKQQDFFVADFSKVPAPLPLTLPNKIPQPTVPQPSFANFDNNPIFFSTKGNNQITTAVTSATNDNSPTEDRYAALKDLDSLMKQASLKDESVSSTVPWNLKDTNNVSNPTRSTLDQTSFISNPFVGDTWHSSVNLLNNNFNNSNNNFQQQVCTPAFNSANPFRQTQIPMFNNELHWFGRDTQNVENVPASHFSLLNKTWQPSISGFKANPFVVGSALANTTQNANNPFL